MQAQQGQRGRATALLIVAVFALGIGAGFVMDDGLDVNVLSGRAGPNAEGTAISVQPAGEGFVIRGVPWQQDGGLWQDDANGRYPTCINPEGPPQRVEVGWAWLPTTSDGGNSKRALWLRCLSE